MGKKGSSKRKMKKVIDKKLKNLNSNKVANEDLGRAMRDLRSSNAAVPHTPSYKKGTRSVKNRKAIEEFE